MKNLFCEKRVFTLRPQRLCFYNENNADISPSEMESFDQIPKGAQTRLFALLQLAVNLKNKYDYLPRPVWQKFEDIFDHDVEGNIDKFTGADLKARQDFALEAYRKNSLSFATDGYFKKLCQSIYDVIPFQVDPSVLSRGNSSDIAETLDRGFSRAAEGNDHALFEGLKNALYELFSNVEDSAFVDGAGEIEENKYLSGVAGLSERINSAKNLQDLKEVAVSLVDIFKDSAIYDKALFDKAENYFMRVNNAQTFEFAKRFFVNILNHNGAAMADEANDVSRPKAKGKRSNGQAGSESTGAATEVHERRERSHAECAAMTENYLNKHVTADDKAKIRGYIDTTFATIRDPAERDFEGIMSLQIALNKGKETGLLVEDGILGRFTYGQIKERGFLDGAAPAAPEAPTAPAGIEQPAVSPIGAEGVKDAILEPKDVIPETENYNATNYLLLLADKPQGLSAAELENQINVFVKGPDSVYFPYLRSSLKSLPTVDVTHIRKIPNQKDTVIGMIYDYEKGDTVLKYVDMNGVKQTPVAIDTLDVNNYLGNDAYTDESVKSKRTEFLIGIYNQIKADVKGEEIRNIALFEKTKPALVTTRVIEGKPTLGGKTIDQTNLVCGYLKGTTLKIISKNKNTGDYEVVDKEGRKSYVKLTADEIALANGEKPKVAPSPVAKIEPLRPDTSRNATDKPQA